MYQRERLLKANFHSNRNSGFAFRNSGSRSRGSRSFSDNRAFSHTARGNNNHSGRKIVSFDPSLFIQKASHLDETKQIEEIYHNQYAFADFAVDETIKINLSAKGYQIPTPIQDQIIPSILANRDAVGIADTGTGKTAAFLIPLIDKVLKNPNTRVLVITPTRELALQIRDELVTFSQNLAVFSTICIGGSSIARQIARLQRRPAFVIGTPGRLKDLAQRHKLNFMHFDTIVLDEVDRMLDMGFVHDVKNIISQLPKERQSLFFSATTNKKVEAIMQGFLSNPVFVAIKSTESKAHIDQSIISVRGKSKIDVLQDLLIQKEFQKVLVFGRTKYGMEKLTRELNSRGFKVASIHGNKSQGQRQKALQQFRDDHVQILLATDVVSRGLDIKDVTHVINYDLPETYEDYIHRIGRTGRANKTGIALTFVE
ncbi:MAG TPA: DEAD/DEAH box helicase [Candidatus Woesebacteria bacterium]|nr:DEAD/DEAH box helicase [Candidatus Woesebacteria bacterium]